MDLASHTDGRCIVGITQEYFRCRVGQRPARGVQFMTGHKTVTESEIGQLDLLRLVEEDDVFRFEISVDDVKLMAVTDGINNLQTYRLINSRNYT